MDVPADAPDECPVCDHPYESVSRHAGGLMVNLLDNERYRRVCFRPVAVTGEPHVDFYHHTHGQTGTDVDADRDSDVGSPPPETATRTAADSEWTDQSGGDVVKQSRSNAEPEDDGRTDPDGAGDTPR